jgi:hypothetical protein
LLEWAEQQFDLNKQDADGITKRDHLEQVERQTGRSLQELEPTVVFPDLLANVWSAFCDLSNTRSQGVNGPNPISYRDIKDYKEMTEMPISPREVKSLRDLDMVYMRTANG